MRSTRSSFFLFSIAFLLLLAGTFSAFAQDLIPTDPSINRINFAQSSYGSTITGGTSNNGDFPVSRLIDGLASDTSRYVYTPTPSGSFLLDLGQERTIHTLQLHLWDGDDRYYRYLIEGSSDNLTFTTLVDATTGKQRGIERHEIDPQALRYIKITGTYNSANSEFHLIDEIHAIGDEPCAPEIERTVTIDGIANSGSSYSVGQSLTLHAGIYEFEHVSGAISWWPNNNNNGGKTWGVNFRATVPLYNKVYGFGDINNAIDFAVSAAEAEALYHSRKAIFYLPVETNVRFWNYDTGSSDNRGSITLAVRQISGPNDSMLTRVRDSMMRSVLWQQQAVGVWQNWVADTSGRYCYGCHVQTYASRGLNESRQKLAELPVDAVLEDTLLQTYAQWQNPAGFASPYHGNSFRISQTSLWAWAVASYPEGRINQLIPNLSNALNWLLTQERSGGGWNYDHGDTGLRLYADGNPSAAHTTGNMQALARMVDVMGEGAFHPFDDVSLDNGLVNVGSARLRHDVLLADAPDVTAVRVTISDSYADNGNFVLNEIRFLADSTPIGVASASANAQQNGLPISESYNGVANDINDGWGYSPANVRNNPAVGMWILSQPADLTRISLHQIYPGHSLREYLVEVTTDPSPSASSIFTPALITSVGTYFDDSNATVQQYLAAIRRAVDVYSAGSWAFDRNVRTAAQTLIGLHSAIPYMTPEQLAPARARIAAVAAWLREHQQSEGGWNDAGDLVNVPRVYPSSIALKALLLVTDTGIDEAIARAAEYVLETQRPDGSWYSPPIETRLSVTTWVEIALPTLFDTLQQELQRSIVDDLTAIGLSGEVELSWSPVPEAASYTIRRRTAETPWTVVASGYQSDVASWRDTEVQNEVPYYYSITWLNVRGEESAESNEASATPYGVSCGGDAPPLILSAPPTGALQDHLYQYQVDARDPDPDDTLTYSLDTAPAAMLVDATTGLISWIPTQSQTGSHFVRLRVQDRIGRFATQAWRITAAPIYLNYAPEFVSTPVTTAVVDHPYVYRARALDPNVSDLIDYSLRVSPSGMSINSSTGRVSWRPVASQEGLRDVELAATDAGALLDTQQYSIQVSANHPPVITSTPNMTGSRFRTWHYEVEASDPDGSRLSYSLSGAPSGMLINATTGLLLWSPPSVVLGDYPLSVVVTDEAGATATQTFTLHIPENDAPIITSSPRTHGAVQSIYRYQVRATDPEGGALSYHLLSGPVGMSMSGAGELSWIPAAEESGDYSVSLEVRDPEGAASQQSYVLNVSDVPEGSGAPSISLVSPEPGSTLLEPVDVVADITVPGYPAQALSWTSELKTAGGELVAQLGSGSTQIQHGVVGRIDPTLLVNDAYVLFLHVTTGNSLYTNDYPYTVSTNLKLGEFKLDAKDISIPLPGLSLDIRRGYSTLDLAPYEFGRGWKLKLPGRVVDSAPESPEQPFNMSTRVFVTRPDGKRVGFTFAPYMPSAWFPIWIPAFRADPGVTDVLEVDQDALFQSGGMFFSFFGNYNPSRYYLTTRERVRYTIVEGQGLVEAQDANHNLLSFTDGAITHSSGAGLTLSRDAAGRITSVTTPDGSGVTYAYSPAGDLASVTDQAGQVTQYNYDASHRITSVVDPAGNTVLTNVYSADGRLIRQLDGLGHEIEVAYDTDNLTESVTDRRGNVTLIAHDENGNVTQITDPAGGVRSYTYDDNYNMTSSTDPLGHTRHYNYSPASNLLSYTNALGQATSFSYNNLSLVTSVTRPNGDVHSFSYDASGNLIWEADPAGHTRSYTYSTDGRVLTSTDPLGHVTTYSYDGQGRISALTDPMGHTAILAYDARGNLSSITKQRSDTSRAVHSVVTSYQYDDLNRPTRVTDAEGYYVTLEWNRFDKPARFVDRRGVETTFEYDANGALVRINRPDGTHQELVYDEEYNQLSETDRLGRQTTWIYDQLGRHSGYAAPDGSSRHYTYDAAGNIASEIDAGGGVTAYTSDAERRRLTTTDPAGNTSQSAYDSLGRQISFSDFAGRITTYEYNDAGKIIAMHYPDGTSDRTTYDGAGREVSFTDRRGDTTHKTYDAAGRLVQETEPNGASRTYVYDEVGNRVSNVDELGNASLLDYDNLGRLIRSTSPQGSYTEYQYDPNGNITRQRDAAGRQTSFVFDVNERNIQTTNPDGGVIHRTYDALGNLLSLSDPLGQLTQYQYDNMNRVTTVIDPLGFIQTTSYDTRGNKSLVLDRNGREKHFFYDAMNRLIREEWHAGGALLNTKEFSFDAAGNRISAADAASHYQYAYDNLHRPVSIAVSNTTGLPDTVISRSYDADDNIVQESDDFGVNVQSVYDASGRTLSRLWHGLGIDPARIDYSYDPAGRVTGIERDLDLAGTEPLLDTGISVDADGRIASLTHQNAVQNTLINSRVYDYNASGGVAHEQAPEGTLAYAYDFAGQLISRDAPLPADDESFAYDLGGNRSGGGYMLGNGNRIIADATYDYTYDHEGNLISRLHRASGETLSLSYNHDNQIVSFEKRSSGNVLLSSGQYIYDVNARRIGKVVDGVSSYYLYNDDNVWMDVNAAQMPTRRYLFGDRDDDILASAGQGGSSFYLKDKLGSVLNRVDRTGAVTNSLSYSAFGLPRNETGSGDRFKFTGREYDAETGLYHYRARQYDPGLGRFVSQDPLGFVAGDTNLYRYVGNSPVNYTDPSGTMLVEESSVLRHGPAYGVASSQNAVLVEQQILSVANGLKDAAATVAEAESLAREIIVFYAWARDIRFALRIAKGISTIFLLSSVVIPAGTEEDVVTISPDGTRIRRFEREIVDGLTEGRETRERRCDPGNPQAIWPKIRKENQTPSCGDSTFDNHIEPRCSAVCRPSKSCFYSLLQAVRLSLDAWETGYPTGVPNRREKCFPFVVGYEKSDKYPRWCVQVQVDSECRYHGWPVQSHRGRRRK